MWHSPSVNAARPSHHEGSYVLGVQCSWDSGFNTPAAIHVRHKLTITMRLKIPCIDSMQIGTAVLYWRCLNDVKRRNCDWPHSSSKPTFTCAHVKGLSTDLNAHFQYVVRS